MIMALEWLKGKVKLTLEITDSEWEYAVTQPGAAEPGKQLVWGGFAPDGALYVLEKFLGAEGAPEDTIFLYTTEDQETVERERPRCVARTARSECAKPMFV